MYQHKYARKNLDENNAMVKHLFEKEHNVKIECEVVARVSDTNKRKLIESVLINNVGNFNIKKNNLKMDTLTNLIIRKLPSIKKMIINEK